MPQFLIPPQNIQNNQFHLSGKDAHHLVRVLRVKPGDRHQFSDGAGRQFVGEILGVDVSTPRVTGKILEEVNVQSHKPEIFLIQGFPKGTKWDYVLEKAAELGVKKIIPFLSSKNPVKWDPKSGEIKVKRWKRILEAAIKQSGESQIPEVVAPRPLSELGIELKGGTLIVAHPGEKSVELVEFLNSSHSFPDPLKLVIGPESGLSDSELEWLRDLGGHQVKWGNSIFRTETAGLVFVSILKYVLRDILKIIDSQ